MHTSTVGGNKVHANQNDKLLSCYMLLDLEVLTQSRQTNALPLLLFQVQAHYTEQHRACTIWDDSLLVMVQTDHTDSEKP